MSWNGSSHHRCAAEQSAATVWCWPNTLTIFSQVDIFILFWRCEISVQQQHTQKYTQTHTHVLTHAHLKLNLPYSLRKEEKPTENKKKIKANNPQTFIYLGEATMQHLDSCFIVFCYFNFHFRCPNLKVVNVLV